ncbi:SIMPL domain-containing protein [Novosphingobium sp. H3SJ31-1]|uniref:SIMPL domain-containing protein n=1 Tax=Novosphingobium album (ex Liu et al. 2023) TaxID=3031130 RepID=A0ABT5WND3_9SPHN|nr:SIMPL domain-containing protein [Novosphingobium album (ex Liu et al. 2023)]MDE8651555.1 SIMPL domain-containing protein [Novosphingobium album (ex Liu et al. 2023)]
MKSAVLLAAAAFAATTLAQPAMAQQTPVPTLEASHTLLTVSAQGASTREPDMAMFTAGVTTQGPSASAALAENSTRMTAVIAALKRAGIADKDIQTSNLNLNPVYAPPKRLPDGSYEAGDQSIVGYQANNTVSVRQRKLDNFGKVIDALVTAGANQVNGPNFMLARPEEALDEARVEAMKIARQRAQLYAQAAGLRVVRIISISENGGYAPQPVMYRRAAADSLSAAPPPPPVAAGELEMNMGVTVQFELAP